MARKPLYLSASDKAAGVHRSIAHPRNCLYSPFRALGRESA